MADLQARIDNVFGALGSSAGTDTPAWQLARHPVFREGSACADSDEDEYSERRRRVEGMDLTEEDAPDAQGLMPSPAFCAQIDREEEEDAADAAALAIETDPRPSPGTEIADDDAYDRLCAALEAPDDASPMEEDAGVSTGGSTPSATGSARRRAPSPSSSGSLKSNLRKNARPAGIKKRVSFTGLPEPPKPWVPPHKRPGYTRTGAAPPSPSPSPPSLGFLAPPPSSTAGAVVPDHVANPGRYRRYDLDESVVVGGGIGQLSSEKTAADRDLEGEQAMQDALAATRIGDGPEEEREEGVQRWQGPVGGGIEFRPRQAPAAAGASREERTGPGGVALDFSSQEAEEGGELTAGRAKAAARQYRRRAAVEDPSQDEDMGD